MRRAADSPAEERGLARDGVRMLVATTDGLADARFSDLPRFLMAGDLLVINTSATLAAAVDGHRRDGRPVSAHFSTPLDGGSWLVELRETAPAFGRVTDAEPGEIISLPAGSSLTLAHRYPDRAANRMWVASLSLGRVTAGDHGHAWADGGAYPADGDHAAADGDAYPAGGDAYPAGGDAAGSANDVGGFLARHGRPIRYSYVPQAWPIAAYQTVFAQGPGGSAEMPSAGRPFTAELVTRLVSAGVVVAPVTLHAGVGSLEAGEQPLPERFTVPGPTAALVNLTRSAGRRVVAVGTTVTRALESAADADGQVHADGGWTDLVLGAGRPARVVGGLITGWHDPEASHLALLEAVAGPALVKAAYAEAEQAGYLGHEFGDSCLLLPPIPGRPGHR